MTASYERPNHEALLAEQAVVQAEKVTGRLLQEYSDLIFPDQNWREPRGSAMVDFVKPIMREAPRVTLDGFLENLAETKSGEPVTWVDMGGGRALAMRQLAMNPAIAPKLTMMNVDLFNVGLEGLDEGEVAFLEDLAPGMTQPAAAPALITDNIETVTLPVPADVITSVEAIQYLNDPVAALCNWYNQLKDNGVMFVATDHEWASWIRYQRNPAEIPLWDETPTKHVLEGLASAGIRYAITYESDWEGSGFRPKVRPSHFRAMAIQKKPGTALRATQPVAAVWVNPYHFKAAYYPDPRGGGGPLVEVVTTP